MSSRFFRRATVAVAIFCIAWSAVAASWEQRAATARAEIAAGHYLPALRIYTDLSRERPQYEFEQRLLETLLNNHPGPVTLLAQARALRYFGQEALATRIYMVLARHYPKSALIRCEQAMQQLEMGNVVKARALIARGAQLRPGAACVDAARGAMLQADGKFSEALKAFDQALAKSPWMGGVRQRRALIASLVKGFDPRGTPINAPIGGAGVSATVAKYWASSVRQQRHYRQNALRSILGQMAAAVVQWDAPSLGFPWRLKTRLAGRAHPLWESNPEPAIAACRFELSRGDLQGAIARLTALQSDPHQPARVQNDASYLLAEAWLVAGANRRAADLVPQEPGLQIFRHALMAWNHDQVTTLKKSYIPGLSPLPRPGEKMSPYLNESQSMDILLRLWKQRLASPKVAEDYLLRAWREIEVLPTSTFDPEVRFKIAVADLRKALASPSIAAADPLTAATFPVNRAEAERVLAHPTREAVLRLVQPAALRHIFERYEVSEVQRVRLDSTFTAQRAYRLGLQFLNGNGVPTNAKEAVYLFGQVCQNNPWADYQIARCAEHGWGMPRNLGEAVEFYEDAAKMGIARAKARATEVRGELDKEEYRRLIAHGDSPAEADRIMREELISNTPRQESDGFPPINTLPPGADLHSKDQGRMSITDEAARGNAAAEWLMGERYADGYGVPPNLSTAVDWYRKAAQQNELGAQFALGKAYLFGDGVPRNLAKARAYLQEATRDGDRFWASAFLPYASGPAGHPNGNQSAG